jgi:hypothetical protein
LPIPVYKKICYASKPFTETFEVPKKDDNNEEDARN